MGQPEPKAGPLSATRRASREQCTLSDVISVKAHGASGHRAKRNEDDFKSLAKSSSSAFKAVPSSDRFARRHTSNSTHDQFQTTLPLHVSAERMASHSESNASEPNSPLSDGFFRSWNSKRPQMPEGVSRSASSEIPAMDLMSIRPSRTTSSERFLGTAKDEDDANSRNTQQALLSTVTGTIWNAVCYPHTSQGEYSWSIATKKGPDCPGV